MSAWTTLETDVAPGDTVQLRGVPEIDMVVLGALWRLDSPVEYEVGWFSNGQHQTMWVPRWRIVSIVPGGRG